MNPMGNCTSGSYGTFDSKTMLQSKLVTDVGIPEEDPQLNVIQKSMVVDSSPKLTHSDWIKEQSEDLDINHIVQFLKFDKLKKYVAREMGSSGIRVLPVDAVHDENIRVLHRNMLFPKQSATDSDSVTAKDDKHLALMKADLLMDLHFNS